ncbi:MAG: glycosyl transferase [Ignavibacteria bacterium RBG_16_34_14]|nr:MAG: glycosyl transferase [Ignavibacteria bacterium RBG_16_34_14]
MNLAPIILFVYNRPRYTKQTIDSLSKNSLAKESELFIYSDAPKSQKDKKSVSEVREYLKTINGYKNVVIKESQINKGLAKSITSGVTEIVERYGKAIVLEDDLFLSAFFLKYMNEALRLYESEKDVISIHGYVYPVKEKLPETFFLRGADCWGWATWNRGWSLYQDSAERLLKQIMRGNLEREFDFNESYNYIKMLKQQIKGEIDSWAIKWYASAFVNEKLTLYPGRSLVKNIGTEGLGTHVQSTKAFDSDLSEIPIKIDKIKISENIEARKIFEEYFRSIKLNLFNRGLKRVESQIKKIIYPLR